MGFFQRIDVWEGGRNVSAVRVADSLASTYRTIRATAVMWRSRGCRNTCRGKHYTYVHMLYVYLP